MLQYPAIIHNDEDGLWLSFPDLNDSGTQGDTMEELIENAEDMLSAYLEVLIEEGKPLPEPSSLNKEHVIYIKALINLDAYKKVS